MARALRGAARKGDRSRQPYGDSLEIEVANSPRPILVSPVRGRTPQLGGNSLQQSVIVGVPAREIERRFGSFGTGEEERHVKFEAAAGSRLRNVPGEAAVGSNLEAGSADRLPRSAARHDHSGS